MFRWASPQPLPSALVALLERAGVSRCDPHQSPDLRVFLPPHLLVAAGATSEGVLSQAYDGLDHGISGDGAWGGDRLVNAERLLGLRPAEISHWLLTNSPPQRPLGLAPVDPLLAVVTLALLEQWPQLVSQYQRLDNRSARAGAAPELDYRLRLRPSATGLLTAWGELSAHRQERQGDDLLQARQHLQALAGALEQQVIETQHWREKASERLRTNRRLLSLLQRLQVLMQRLMGLS